MKNWIDQHLNWALVIAIMAAPLIASGIILLLPGDSYGWGYVFGHLYFWFILLCSLYVIRKKGRSGLWILLYPLTLFIIPLFLANKNTGQYQNSKTTSEQTVQHRP